MTPMLILLFGFDPKTAVGTDILHGAIFKSFGAWRHRKLGNVHAHLALWMLVGSAPLSLVGVEIASSFSDDAHRRWAGSSARALILGGVGFLAEDVPAVARRDDATVPAAAARQGARRPDRCDLRLRRRPDLGRLRHVLRSRDAAPLPAHAHARSSAPTCSMRRCSSGSPGTGHLLHGNVDLHAIAWLLVGSIPGVLIGSNLSVRVPERALRMTFAFVLILSGIKLVEMPRRDAHHRGRHRRRARSCCSAGRRALRQRRLLRTARADRPARGAPRRIARAWPGSCRRRSSSPCSRRPRAAFAHHRGREARASRRSTGRRSTPGLLAAARSGEARRADQVPPAHSASGSTSGSRTSDGTRSRRSSPPRTARAGTVFKLRWDGFSGSGVINARRRLPAGRQAPALASHDRPAEPDPPRHRAAGRSPSGIRSIRSSRRTATATRTSSAFHFDVNEPAHAILARARTPASCSRATRRRPVCSSGTAGSRTRAGARPCAARQVPAHGRRAQDIAGNVSKGVPFAIAQVRYVALARTRVVVRPGGRFALRVSTDAPRVEWRLHGRSGVQRSGRCTSVRPRAKGVFQLYVSAGRPLRRTTVVVA